MWPTCPETLTGVHDTMPIIPCLRPLPTFEQQRPVPPTLSSNIGFRRMQQRERRKQRQTSLWEPCKHAHRSHSESKPETSATPGHREEPDHHGFRGSRLTWDVVSRRRGLHRLPRRRLWTRSRNRNKVQTKMTQCVSSATDHMGMLSPWCDHAHAARSFTPSAGPDGCFVPSGTHLTSLGEWIP